MPTIIVTNAIQYASKKCLPFDCIPDSVPGKTGEPVGRIDLGPNLVTSLFLGVIVSTLYQTLAEETFERWESSRLGSRSPAANIG